MEFQSIHNQKAYKQIIEQIISLIVKGELKNGDKLPSERQLSEMLQSSRASIREAFRTLEILGILEVRHGGGTYVTDFHIAPFINTISPLFLKDVDIMGDMMDFRIFIESEAVRAAAGFCSPATLDRMSAALTDMASDDVIVAERADLDFHMSIFSATGNGVFMLAGECLSYILYTSIHTNRIKLVDDREITGRWLEEHQRILKAVKAQQPEEAAAALRSHLEGVRRYVLDSTMELGASHEN